MASTDILNLPKAGSTGNRVHDRFVIMLDTCWISSVTDMCDGYGWNTPVYSIAADCDGNTNWTWVSKLSYTGYNVPQQLHEVLGWAGS